MKLRLVALLLIVGTSAGAAHGFGIRGYVIANGGHSTPASNGVFESYGTAGQPAVGYSLGPGAEVCSGFWCFGGSRVVSVGPPGGGSPSREFAMGRATPNPTRDRARFDLVLPAAATVSLSVHDVAGRQVGEIVSRRLDAGAQEVSWRAAGVQAGIYFVRLYLDGSLKARRTIVVIR